MGLLKDLFSRAETAGGLRADVVAPPKAERFSEGGSPLSGVEIFSTGVHRGKRYGPGDLDAMVRNFRQFSTGPKARVRVPAVLGHEETQEFLERSDLPAAAWPNRVYRQGRLLKADFDDPPPVVKRLLKNKAYRTVSSEVYDEPPAGVPGRGKMLRRIAFLGGDIPELKTLDEIAALTEHSESRGRRFAPYRRHVFKFRESVARSNAPGIFFVFAEVRPVPMDPEEVDLNPGGGGMDPDEMLGMLADHGIDTSVLEGLSPEGMAEVLRACDAKDEAAGGGGDSEYDEDPEEEPDEEMKAKYRERAKKFADRLSAYKSYCDEDDMRRMSEMFAADSRHAEDDTVSALTARPKKITRTEHYSEKRVAEIVREQVAAALKADAGDVRKFAEETRAAEKRRAAEAICDRLGLEGRLPPAERPAVLSRLMRADPKTVVEKFSEVKGGKKVVTEATEFDLQVRELEARPRFFHERARSGERGTAGGAREEDAEAEKVGQHYEMFKEDFPRGVTREGLVEGFKAAKKHDAGLTAQQFLNQ